MSSVRTHLSITLGQVMAIWMIDDGARDFSQAWYNARVSVESALSIQGPRQPTAMIRCSPRFDNRRGQGRDEGAVQRYFRLLYRVHCATPQPCHKLPVPWTFIHHPAPPRRLCIVISGPWEYTNTCSIMNINYMRNQTCVCRA